MKYRADLINFNKIITDSFTGATIDDLKKLCGRPGYTYLVKIYAVYEDLADELVITYHYKSKRFYKI